jgi:hypothetical protein
MPDAVLPCTAYTRARKAALALSFDRAGGFPAGWYSAHEIDVITDNMERVLLGDAVAQDLHPRYKLCGGGFPFC